MTPTTKNQRNAPRIQHSAFSIQKSMPVMEILTILPHSESLLAQYGLSCFHCSANAVETLEQGCKSHGFATEDIDDLVTDLNELLKDAPLRPQTIMLTKEAAIALRDIQKAEKKEGQGLLVDVDEHGGFAMEFAASDAGFSIFLNAEVPDVRIFATSQTLLRIGGATIDYREGRFKLDLPEDAMKGACGCADGGEECGCK